ncbi:TerB family tellurite resistance protein [uncultured Algimonas sp.]|uniref:TerB family tellurite resistance protein n=1 Tax=uncultured Algimonas sp. TaxID=1547920 RepID=UPI0026269D0E|nr:TerB family tellurite resistance protein [uncultured Algimonas sp.]
MILARLLSAAAQLFGPQSATDGRGVAGDNDDAPVVAALIALGAKMAKADGEVRAEDIAAFDQVFRADAASRSMVERFFGLARQTTLGFERYARRVARHFRARPAALEDVMDGLFHIALADGILTDDENEYLSRVADIFGFSDAEYARLKATHVGRDADDPYLILGIDETIGDDDLRKAYRRAAASNHPDRLVARGLPPEMTALATHKMALINRAYAQILAQRKQAKAICL